MQAPQTVAEFMAALRATMQLANREQILQSLSAACQRLQEAEYYLQVARLSLYERRRLQQDVLLMQQNLAQARQAKVPRPEFRFSSRKYVTKKAEAAETEVDARYADDRILRGIQDKTVDLREDAQIAGKDFAIQEARGCAILLPHLESVYCSNL
jgi:hypothetical protein